LVAGEADQSPLGDFSDDDSFQQGPIQRECRQVRGHFHHLPLFLSEVRRVLSSDGRFVMADQISPSAAVFDWLDYWERTRDPLHFVQRTVEQWREEMTRARWRWVEHRIVPYRLELDWWVETAGCTDSVISALAEHAVRAPDEVRELLNLEFDSSGRVIAFQEPMLVVRLEHANDACRLTNDSPCLKGFAAAAESYPNG
jgi:hypothetical protein